MDLHALDRCEGCKWPVEPFDDAGTLAQSRDSKPSDRRAFIHGFAGNSNALLARSTFARAGRSTEQFGWRGCRNCVACCAELGISNARALQRGVATICPRVVVLTRARPRA